MAMRLIVTSRRDYIFASNFYVLAQHLDTLINEACREFPTETPPVPTTKGLLTYLLTYLLNNVNRFHKTTGSNRYATVSSHLRSSRRCEEQLSWILRLTSRRQNQKIAIGLFLTHSHELLE